MASEEEAKKEYRKLRDCFDTLVRRSRLTGRLLIYAFRHLPSDQIKEKEKEMKMPLNLDKHLQKTILDNKAKEEQGVPPQGGSGTAPPKEKTLKELWLEWDDQIIKVSKLKLEEWHNIKKMIEDPERISYLDKFESSDAVKGEMKPTKITIEEFLNAEHVKTEGSVATMRPRKEPEPGEEGQAFVKVNPKALKQDGFKKQELDPVMSNTFQVGGDHYAKDEGKAGQIWDRIILKYGWHRAKLFFMGSILKYVERHEDKDGLKDLRKAHHFLAKMIKEEEKYQQEQKKNGS